ncbi:hypothetical protein GSbR_29960 [Geobacter sp. SVR]|nr:hypothetical protein GSVR_31040 [Geobacter sp. SVR]GCF86396.1 hypothetical protein GSbR_29960 [Geobacter sp. SVR]
MRETSCGSMKHYEHMCSLTLNGCAIEKLLATGDADIAPCGGQGS